jgi:hypothetical protein
MMAIQKIQNTLLLFRLAPFKYSYERQDIVKIALKKLLTDRVP